MDDSLSDLVTSHSSSTPLINNGLPVIGFEDENVQRQYGYRGLKVLASNNKDCLRPESSSPYPAVKRMYAMRNPPFGKAYNELILPDILAILDPTTSTSFVLPQFKELHAVHMRVWDDEYLVQAFDVVLLVFDLSLGTISACEAKDLVLRVSECIQKHWPVSATPVYTDICESNVMFATGHARTGDKWKDPRTFSPNVYLEETPRPGASIGNSNFWTAETN
ncbi:hypothetical protein BKA65DRAFT_147022 [Rhexocercosporidium sp. MPI-PUGE-AT-0058]|nr:hypothetical protein BKA65DRAFT_147022 [Rhexocercosporidium sp. MPI-PUGE-AT-0058]